MFLLRIHHKQEIDKTKQFVETLGYMLGVYWQLDDLSQPIQPPLKIKQDKVMIPLSVAVAISGMNPKAFSKMVEEAKTKAYNNNRGVDSQLNANDLSKDEYLKLFGTAQQKARFK